MHRTGLLLRLAPVAAVAALATWKPLPAQELAQLRPGQKVRVTIPSANLILREATLQSIQAGTITLRTARDTLLPIDSITLAAPIDSVRSLDVSVGRRNFARVGALIGGGMGLVVGMGMAVKQVDRCHDSGGFIKGGPWCELNYLFAPAAMLVGGWLGALIGRGWSGERWEPVPLARARVGLVPLWGGRLGLGASLAF